MPSDVNYGWSVASEKAFIDGLGSHTNTHVHDPSKIIQLLTAYRNSLKIRYNFCGMSPKELDDHAARRIAYLQFSLNKETKK